MSLFKAEVVPVTLQPHPDADRLSIAQVVGWTCVTATQGFLDMDTDRGVYIMLDSIVPQDRLEEWGLLGKLGGKLHNRVKTVRLRGVISQGLLIPVSRDIPLGTDLAPVYGITKYEPPVKVILGGGGNAYVTLPWPSDLAVYDIERMENYPDELQPGEMVVATEKLEGTNVAFHMNADGFVVCSRGVTYDPDAEENQAVLYVRAATAFGLRERITNLVGLMAAKVKLGDYHSVTIRGEIIGPKVQNNIYNLTDMAFRVFDIDVNGRPLPYHQLKLATQVLGLEMVPELYTGPFPSDHRVVSYGPSAYNVNHLREGAVWKPLTERRSLALGRVQVKAVDPEYLLGQKD